MNQTPGINAYDKPVENDFEYVYTENKDKAFRKVTKAMMKVLLGVATKLSELENDKNFIDNTVADLKNYYLKTETYSKEELDDKLSLIPRFSVQVVSSLPTENISDTTVYLVPSDEDEDNLYTEYINVNGLWEILGTQKMLNGEVVVTWEDIKDRPFGESEVELLSETTLTFSNGQTYHSLLGLVEGEKYVVNWDGKEYETVAQSVVYQGMNMVAIGNIEMALGTGDSGEPFAIGDATEYSTSFVACLTGESSATISIKHVVIEKLDPSYIDLDWIPKKKIVATDTAIYGVSSTFSTGNTDRNVAYNSDSTMPTLSEGRYYSVIYNDEEYVVRAEKIIVDTQGEAISLGNSQLYQNMLIDAGIIVKNAKDTGEPFCIISAITRDGGAVLGHGKQLGDAYNITILEAEQINKLPNEFLDLDWIPKTVESDGTVIIDNFVYTSGDSRDTYTEWANGYGAESSIQMKVGEKYNVYWNEKKYICVADKTEDSDVEDGAPFVGNKYFITGDSVDNTGEPFFIQQIGSGDNIMGYLVMISKTDTSASIKCTVTEIIEEVNKIPKEYLPMEAITEAVINALPKWTGGSY